MTIGIYKLVFPNTSKLYIGQSIDIERRYLQHIYCMSKGSSSKELNKAYSVFGKPSLEIVEVTSSEELDQKELHYILKYNAYISGFNSLSGDTDQLFGVNNPNCKYSEEDCFCVLYYLTDPSYTHNDISLILDVSKNVISDISSLKSHVWLKEKYPELYSKVEELAGTRSSINGKHRYPRIVSPEGVVHEVTNITAFAKSNNLLVSGLHKLLNNYRKSYKGWTQENHIDSFEKYSDIVSPLGAVFSISKNGLSEFARAHGLLRESLQRLVRGKAESHRGWKRVVKNTLE